MRKIKFLFFMTFSLLAMSLFSQTTGNFNYQAVVRDNNGDLIANQSISVQLSIIESTANGTEIYKEAHSVTSTSIGLINLLVGNGTSSIGDFTSINWGENSKFIKIEFDLGSGFTDMGTFQLFSVPYALHANSVENVNDADADSNNEIQNLLITGDTLEISGGNKVVLPYDSSNWVINGDQMYYNGGNVGIGSTSPVSNLEVKSNMAGNDALFQVINSNNDTVFAVYANGVKVYVNESEKGGGGGGFSVSGRPPGKSTGEPCLLITPDSTRVFVNEAVNGKGGGFSVNGRGPGKAESSPFLNLTPENYYIGHEAGINTTTGLNNSFIGYQTGYSNTEGDYNVFLGRKTGYNNTTGSSNIFIGDETGANNTTGYANVYIGERSGYYNDDGYWNIFLGRGSGYSNTTGSANIIIGDFAGFDNSIGFDNVMIGDYAGASNISGFENIFIGKEAGWSNDDGEKNVFVGAFSGFSNESGRSNVFIGDSAGYTNSSGVSNVFLGQCAGKSNTGHYNVFLGTSCGVSNIGGTQNLFLGQQAGENSSTGNYNTYVGTLAGGGNNVNGHENVFLGYGAGYYETGSNKLYIDNNGRDSTNAIIYGDFLKSKLRFNAYVGIGGSSDVSYELYVYGDACADAWTISSDKRWKTNIYTLNNSLEKVLKLRGVSYDWKIKEFPDKKFKKGRQIGFIAQELERVIPEVVKSDDKGFKTVDYSKLTSYLVEAIKEQQKMIEDQKKINQRLEKNNEMLKRDFNILKSKVEKLLNENTQPRTASPNFGD